MIPGSNILNMAMSVIAKENVAYYRYDARAVNSIGMLETSYKPTCVFQGSVQAVPHSQYQNLGLDFNKSYVKVYAPKNALDVTRDISGDQIAWNGRRYQCLSKTDWYGQDGWMEMLCVDIGEGQSPCA